MADYMCMVREKEFVTIGGAYSLANFFDLLSDGIAVDNTFEEIAAYGAGRSLRRYTLGGFSIVGDVSTAIDFKKIGFMLKGALGSHLIEDIGTSDWEHLFYFSEDIPHWIMFLGRQSGEATNHEFQFYGMRVNSLELAFEGPKSATFTANVGGNYHIIRGNQLTPSWDDEPVCVGTDTTVKIGGEEVVVNALTVRVENGVVMDQYHLGGRHQGLRHQIIGTDDEKIMNSDTDWLSDDIPNSPTSDETVITLSDEGGLRWDVDTTDSPTDSITNSASLVAADLRGYDRLGFFFYQDVKASGAEVYNFQLENAGYSTIYTIDSNDFDAQTWYYLTIDISADTRDDVDGFKIVAPAALTTNYFIFANMTIWDSRKMPVQGRVISGTIDVLFQNDDQYQRFLDGTTSATAAGTDYTNTSLNIDVLSTTLVTGGAGAHYFRMRLDMPRIVYKTPGGPNLSGTDALRMSIEYDALFGTGTDANIMEGTHAGAPSSWDLMASLVNNMSSVEEY